MASFLLRSIISQIGLLADYGTRFSYRGAIWLFSGRDASRFGTKIHFLFFWGVGRLLGEHALWPETYMRAICRV